MKKLIRPSVLLLGLLISSQSFASENTSKTDTTSKASADSKLSDVEKGKVKSGICSACHGANGKATAPIYPNLAGQSKAYLISALTAYKEGKRQGGMSSIMMPMAKGLSADDIKNLAAYYSSLPAVAK